MAFLNSPFIHGSGFRNLFNIFFATVAEKIGENVVYDPSNHPSITAIHENNSIDLNRTLMHTSKD
jgi:hypothetical protein